MRYTLNKDLFARGDDYLIKDEADRDVYFIDGRGISLRNHLSFQNMHGIELAAIRQVAFSWGTQHELLREGKLVAKVTENSFGDGSCQFAVDVPGPDDPVAVGDFYNHEYSIKLGDQTLARVSRNRGAETASITSSGFGIEVAEDADPVLMLASAIVIDLAANRPE
jgi:uncharacterized protein YxjI